MNFPADLKYTESHEWVRVEADGSRAPLQCRDASRSRRNRNVERSRRHQQAAAAQDGQKDS